MKAGGGWGGGGGIFLYIFFCIPNVRRMGDLFVIFIFSFAKNMNGVCVKLLPISHHAQNMKGRQLFMFIFSTSG